MAILIRFRLALLAAAMVPLLLFSAPATNMQVRHQAAPQELRHLGCYMPLCSAKVTHPLCDVQANVKLSNGLEMSSSGKMDMKITGNSEEGAEFVWQTLAPVSFKSEGDAPELGHVVWSLDESRQLAADEVTKIQANNAGEEFPATCDIYFYVQATADAYPGQVFRSRTPVHMRSTDLMTFSPHVNELYKAVSPIDFESEDGAVAFTVVELSSTLN